MSKQPAKMRSIALAPLADLINDLWRRRNWPRVVTSLYQSQQGENMPPRVTPITGPGRAVETAVVNGSVEADPWGLLDAMHILIYGDSGTGKTTLASTFPAPIYWMICSRSKQPGELKSIKTPENMKRITPRIVSSVVQLRAYMEEAKSYKTVVLDHASGLADLMLKEIMGLERLPVQKGWKYASKEQYQQQSSNIKDCLEAFLDLPCNVVIIAHEKVHGDESESREASIIKPVVGASLSKSVAGWLHPSCDYVVQTLKMPRTTIIQQDIGDGQTAPIPYRDGVNFCLRVGPHETYLTKMRMPKGRVFPPDGIIIDPTYDKILALINGT